MEINLLKNSFINYNMVEGNIYIDFYPTTSLLDSSMPNLTPVLLTSGTIMCFEADFLDRVHSDKFKYYFSSSASYTTTASGIVFSYKNYDFEDYTRLDTFFIDDYYYATFSGTTAYPRYVKVIHTLGTTSGSLYKIVVTNNDTVVGFGEYGEYEEESVAAARGSSFLKAISIYNNNNAMATANVQIESLGVYLDEYIFLSTSESGPWLPTTSKENVIASAGSWFLNENDPDVIEEAGKLVIKGESLTGIWASNLTKAIYTTKVFSFANKFYTNLFVDFDNLALGCRIVVDPFDITQTVTAKSLGCPIDYYIFRMASSTNSNSGYYNFYSQDYDVRTSAFVGSHPLFTSTAPGAISNYVFTINSIGISACVYAASSVYLAVTRSDFSLGIAILLGSASESYFYHVEPDYGEGVWVYLFTGAESAGPMNHEGYFLFHYNSSGIQTFKMTTSNRTIYQFSVIPGGSSIWYTSLVDDCLIKLDINGKVLSSISILNYTNDLRGCCSLEDGGCWYIDGNNLHRVNYLGVIVDSIFSVSSLSTLAHVKVHRDGSLFVRDGERICRISTKQESKGFKYFDVPLAYADRLIPGPEGIWVYCTTGYMYYLGETAGNVMYVLGSALNSITQVYGILNIVPGTLDWERRLPIPTDPVWSVSSFNKIQTSAYYFSSELYHQIQITLQASFPRDKYNVPNSIITWEMEDSFYNEPGYSIPYEHRWTCSSDVFITHIEDAVVVASGIINYIDKNFCVFLGDISNPQADYYQYISSRNKWYLKDYYTEGAYDLYIDYMIPTSNNQDFILNLKVTPTNDYNHSIMTAQIKRESGIFYVGYILAGYRATSDFNTHTDSILFNEDNNNYGRLRLKHSSSHIYGYIYNFSTEAWVQVFDCPFLYGGWGTSDVTFNEWTCYNVRIDYKGTKTIYITDFTNILSNVYWYLDTPKLKGLYLRDCLVVPDIYPNNYKNVYIKTQIPSTELAYRSNELYEYKMRVWWELQL